SLYNVAVPAALAGQEANTVAAMFKAFKPDYRVVAGQINADSRLIAQNFANTTDYLNRLNDASERSTQATSDYLRGNTVISDSYLNGHGRVSDDVASALIAADPNRFQAVSSSNYIRGIDY